MSDKGYYLYAPSSAREPVNTEPLFWSWKNGGWAGIATADIRHGDPAALEVPSEIDTETRWVSKVEATRLYDAWAAKELSRARRKHR